MGCGVQQNTAAFKVRQGIITITIVIKTVDE